MFDPTPIVVEAVGMDELLIPVAVVFPITDNFSMYRRMWSNQPGPMVAEVEQGIPPFEMCLN
jgi:hypothetical protein